MKKNLIIVGIVFASLVNAPWVSATTIDNFDAYFSGALQTVSSSAWSCIAPADYMVENIVFTPPITGGTNGVVSTSTTGACGKTITAESVGVFSVELNNTDISSTNEFRLRNGSSQTRVSVGLLGNAAFSRDSSGVAHQLVGGLSLNHFHLFEIEIKTATDLYRVRVDGGATSDWIGMQNAGASTIAQTRFIPTSSGANAMYADNITYETTATLDAVVVGSTSGDSPAADIAYGIFIFMIGFFGMVWITQDRRIKV